MDFSPDEGQQAVADVVTSALDRDNTWDALVFSGYAANPDFDTITPVTPMAATPEPSAFLLAVCGGTAVLWRRRRRA